MASPGNFGLLISDFQALAAETKRKHSDVKEASDKALALLKSTPDQVLAALRNSGIPVPGPADDIFRPISMACSTKNSKVVVIALGSLQRLIGMDAVPPSKIPQIVNLLVTVLPLGVEIQLRILQTLPSLFTQCSRYLHDTLLAEALLLCFRLQDSRIGVVSSTAAATLRQLVMVVFEGVAAEDKAMNSISQSEQEQTFATHQTDFVVTIPAFQGFRPSGESERTEAHRVALCPSAKDAYLVFEDLCLLVNGDPPSFLKLQSLPKTFGLELIESVMTGHGYLFQQHPELIFVLRAQLCPLLIRALSEKPTFPLTLRLMRVAFLLLKQFSDDLLVEAEIFLSLLIKTISLDHTDGQSEPVPIWLRVLVLEIFRGLCTDFDLLLRLYERYDLRRPDKASGLFTTLMGTFNRLASEKPQLLGISHDTTFGSSSAFQISSSTNPAVQGMIDGVVGIATQAAAPLVGTQQGGLTVATAAMKLQCIDQLDKAEAPMIPETYVYLLALQCLSNVAEGFAGSVMVQHEEIRHSHLNNSPEGSPVVPFVLNADNLKASHNTERIKMIKSMADASWPALLASLNFFVSTNLDNELFTETLAAMQSFTYVCGILDLTTPRDAFILSFCKFAVPPAIVANLAAEASGGTSVKGPQSVLSVDSLGLGPAPVPTSLSTRSLAFLHTLVAIAQYLARSLGNTWYTIFEALQNADYVLAAKLKKRATQSTTSLSPSTSGLSSTNDESAIQANIQKLFDCSRVLDSAAFTDFITSLCRLSSEMVGLPADAEDSNSSRMPTVLSFDTRRKISGLNAIRSLRQNERSFAVTKLGSVALLNIRRLILSDPAVGWVPITSHLLAIQRYSEAPSNIRLQAADVLDRIILSTPKVTATLDEAIQCRIQTQVMQVLARQAETDFNSQTSTDIEVRKLGLETLFKILENNGHSFIAGWKLILDVLRTACSPSSTKAPFASGISTGKSILKPLSNPTTKLSVLVRNGFPPLQLICTDFLTALNLDELHQCIDVLTDFGRQTDDINIALTSGGLLWQVSDHIQAKNHKSEGEDESYLRLWMYLLSRLLDLSRVPRPEVRDGAIQTLFRTVGLYGSTLSQASWRELLWEVVFPLLRLLSNAIEQTSSIEAAPHESPVDIARQSNGAPIDLNAKQLDDSKILALESTGKVVADHFASHIIHTNQFLETWATLIQHLQHSFVCDRPEVSTAAIRTLATVLNSGISNNKCTMLSDAALQLTWEAFVQMSQTIATAPSETRPIGIYFTQTALQAYVQVARSLHNASWFEANFARITKLLQICKIIITYPHSPDYRPDVDSMPPVPAAVVATIDELSLNAPGVPSVVMKCLAELGTLAFVAPFNATNLLSSRSSPSKVSYIALFKAIQPRLVNLIERFCKTPEIYNENAVTQVIMSVGLPCKLKYSCPVSSKHAHAEPLWKTASESFLIIVKRCLASLRKLNNIVLHASFEGFWSQLIDIFAGVLLANCEPALALDLEQQFAEENFDLAFVASLELDVLPSLGQSRVPSHVIQALGSAVQAASRLYELEGEADLNETLEEKKPLSHGIPSHSTSSYGHWFANDMNVLARHKFCGTTLEVVKKPRERFAYWCFDLLFVFCSPVNVDSDLQVERRRLAAIWAPILMARCVAALKTYIADAAIRGAIPFPRLRNEEIMYILQKLLTESLWDNCLAIPLSNGTCAHTPELDLSWSREKLLQVLLIQTPGSHLLYLQPLLIDLLSCENLAPVHAYRELLQAEDRNGLGLYGCSQNLVLGRVGRKISNESQTRDKDMRQLISMALQKISTLTPLKFET
ncbi:hypothetical protein O181_023746 [Austropuccinia psidii MF-1]|uniref:Protein MON2 homolog n=1 Tax=Austropuccinia psidii MF-1 TaxID=1389203 RepID=A0A9Q3GXY5_9BASI|nr:hypothetical protein [Austropuccinia psidii MF-1]